MDTLDKWISNKARRTRAEWSVILTSADGSNTADVGGLTRIDTDIIYTRVVLSTVRVKSAFGSAASPWFANKSRYTRTNRVPT